MNRKEAIEARAKARAERAARRAERVEQRAKAAAECGTLVQSEPTESAFLRTDGRPLHLEGMFRDQAVFVILSGPSLKTLNLSRLNRRGIYTFGVNNSPLVYRPNLWLCVDPPEKFADSIWLDPGIQKLVQYKAFGWGLRHKRGDGTFERLQKDGKQICVKDCPNVVGYRRNSFYDPATFLTEPTINWGNSKKSHARNKRPRILNSMIAILKTCYVLGFRAVFLLGCDFTMDTAQPYAFAQAGDDAKTQSNQNCYRTMRGMFDELQPRFLEAGFHVYNVNPESHLTSFPYLSYEECIEIATAHIPQNVDGAGWYERKMG